MALPYSRGVERGPERRVRTIFWTHRAWRCEYHSQPDGVLRVTLLYDEELVIDHVARDLDEARDIASFWQDLVGPEEWPASDVTNERRWIDDRRKKRPGGRRMDDPPD